MEKQEKFEPCANISVKNIFTELLQIVGSQVCERFDRTKKMRIVIDYDPQALNTEIHMFREDAEHERPQKS